MVVVDFSSEIGLSLCLELVVQTSSSGSATGARSSRSGAASRSSRVAATVRAGSTLRVPVAANGVRNETRWRKQTPWVARALLDIFAH